MRWHFRCGYAVIALLMFRIKWGFVGSRYACFASFPLDLRGTLAYLKTGTSRTLGHQPLAAWFVGSHLAAIFWYAAFRREPLIEPMLIGDKEIESDLVLDPPAEDDARVLIKAAAIFTACAAIVWAVVTKL